ncbi:MAG: hypothetical protein A2Y03_10850 [Omnitrophica WOR_2 bacterium GWF2_38_59]|nr:MAG: hypothetical protein A2Y06_02665 [Omnitrophica WOR_2 bacterium GWA2_37_7]OGX25185.1 MAG: hypothetical protein A2Y03_10850 [Omnitrophica WOR_2 bacterium GWF2_38_59]OGX50624.1 MAG: hypothetical protein A2243_03385 [Omnitrophica WOR_2 bacterium RIFOXYA2_FULL_38_17]OGX53284.1 MAG: hypothetical protein A2267_03530 [Omnitrophica WOR_2 bacterium RIFOXYA12_FULL_38_10]OGX56195.1 MAG: hypothetical protein A2447_08025 [Omnitrophica WOR_2 bacterium RIFOXYC2_FULL_38_12]OGX57316.1 MAG: hypothetical 
MYKHFYNLKENPFNVTADPDFFFFSPHHNEAFSHLTYAIQHRKGISIITGEIGTGKTTLCRMLLNNLEKTIKTALILNPSFSDLQLIRLILKDLGVECKQKNKFALIDALNDFLLEESDKGNNVVLIIDEAQNLRIKQLEQIRLLSNLETEKDKLLQIILVGQPELTEKLKQTSIRQLNQRITVRYHILPLERNDIERYIKHRLSVASNSKVHVHFNKEAIDEIFTLSGGTPRMINIICDRALLAGFTKDTHTITKDIIEESAREVI